ncbi:transcriptional repressor NF-X1-like [Rhopilema esculentum]|uniref:transcriptional repressor NF-X1-like n=1 Tax=Rhopilema esculentum TaxID=499914 RepID=UPI0031DFA6B9|eukprot:gene14785-5891_t
MAEESGGPPSDRPSFNWSILSHTYDSGNNRTNSRGRSERNRATWQSGRQQNRRGRGRTDIRYDGRPRRDREFSDNETDLQGQSDSGYYNKFADKYGVTNHSKGTGAVNMNTTARGRGRQRGDKSRRGVSKEWRGMSEWGVQEAERGDQRRRTEGRHFENQEYAEFKDEKFDKMKKQNDNARHAGQANGTKSVVDVEPVKGNIVDGKYVRLKKDNIHSSYREGQQSVNLSRERNGSAASYQRRGNDKLKKANKWSRKPIDSEQARVLIEQLVEESYECMVCCEYLRSSQPSWCCQNCYHIFHLNCIKQWVKSSVATSAGDVNGWRCPGCQNVTEKMPTNYICFCGKLKNPEWNPRHGIIPHSCGEVCKKQRTSPPCKHLCNELCHPGPCPSCPVMVPKECPCGKTKTKMRCGQSVTLNCKNICNKTLNCGIHRCLQQCHEGPCSVCEVTEEQYCYCGQENRQRKCGGDKSGTMTDKTGKTKYSCKNTCSRTLDCGNHSCSQICHPGSCDSCIFLPKNVEFCPCKQTRITDLLQPDEMRKSCLDSIPCCKNFCGKKLQCGSPDEPHHCKQICHVGPCQPCDGESKLLCRCHSTQTEIPCKDINPEKDILCERRCNKKRRCGRHRCNQKCCVDKEHNCQLICGRKLSCGLHKCDEPCHIGNCPRCWQTSFEERTCYCGETVQYPPIPCGAPLPNCQMPCSRPHPCQHQPQHQCHSEERCPPCVILTQKMCMCNRELRRNVPCHIANVSCGKPCEKELPCKSHKCQKLCHSGDCLTDNERCRQPCATSRRDCPHPCGSPCHVGEDCPEGPCKSQITVKCKCGRKSEKVLCLAGNATSQYHRFASGALGDKLRNLRSGESVDLSGLMLAEKRRGLDCDEECSLQERQRVLADAFGIDNPEANHFPSIQFSYSLREDAKAQLPLVKTIEDVIESLIQKLKKSSLSQISHSFPPMNNSQRKLIHELAGLYNCRTASYDQEPKRNTVLTATRESSLINPKLSTVVERRVNKPMPSPVLNFAEKPLNFQGIPKKNDDLKTKETFSIDYFDDDLP